VGGSRRPGTLDQWRLQCWEDGDGCLLSLREEAQGDSQAARHGREVSGGTFQDRHQNMEGKTACQVQPDAADEHRG
jgi:hypothetical protein